MNTSIRTLAFLGVGLLAAALVACESGDTSTPNLGGPNQNSGVLSIWYQDATGPVDVLNVKFTALSVHNRTTNEWVTLPVQDQTVDLIAAKDNPTVLQTFFNLPVGDYDGIQGTMEIVNFSLQGDDQFCVLSVNQVTIPALLMQQAFVHVDQTGASLLIDIPVLSGTCDPAVSPVGTLQVDIANVSVAPRT